VSSTEKEVAKHSRQVDQFEMVYNGLTHLTTEAYSLIETHSDYDVEADIAYDRLFLDDEEVEGRLETVKWLLHEEVEQYHKEKNALNRVIDKNQEPYVRERYEQIWFMAENMVNNYTQPLLETIE